MPNWCNNTVQIRHADPFMIERVRKAFNDGGLLQEFIPCPQDLLDTVAGFPGEDQREAHEARIASNLEKYGHKDWYDWQVANWGTKWDIGADGQPALDQDDGSLVLNFDSAWSPPVNAYEKLMDLGFEIKAYYFEPGMAFAGIWDNGDDDYYEYGGMDSTEIEANLPDELDEMFGISQSVAEWEEENQED